ncbi:MAG TPA: hypothetical protein VEM38_07600 [Burkholderiales bacterium]|nr:hypothetical protein [Burkholderiales bacterium]
MKKMTRQQRIEFWAAALRELAEALTKRRSPMKITLALPPEFIALCAGDNVKPETVLRGFIADVCGIMNWASNPREDGYSSNGSDERDMAYAYYERCGYPWMHGRIEEKEHAIRPNRTARRRDL